MEELDDQSYHPDDITQRHRQSVASLDRRSTRSGGRGGGSDIMESSSASSRRQSRDSLHSHISDEDIIEEDHHGDVHGEASSDESHHQSFEEAIETLLRRVDIIATVEETVELFYI